MGHNRKLVGISTLDKHYSFLFDLLDNLYEAISLRDSTRMTVISAQIKKTCLKIYEFERPLFNQSKNSTVGNEVIRYRAFLDSINRIDKEMNSGDKLTAARKIDFEVKNWLNDHLNSITDYLPEKKTMPELKTNWNFIFKLFSGLLNRFR